MAYLKLMRDDTELATLAEDGKSLCALPGVPQELLPLNLFLGESRSASLVDTVIWAKKRVFPKERVDCARLLAAMGLAEYDGWEIVRRTGACLMEDPFWLRFEESQTFADTTRGRAAAAGFRL